MTSQQLRVKNISILNEFSGNIVFQRVYEWRATTAFNNLHSMIQAFYQFARMCDDGGKKYYVRLLS